MQDLESVKKRALLILGKRNFSEHEMTKRLIEKGATSKDAEEAVSWLVELGYINDSDYASSIVRYYAKKGYGVSRIKDELYKRKIQRELWDEKISEVDDTEMDDAALAFLQKKLRGSDDKDDLRRASDALVRRGFNYDDARTAVSKYLELTGAENA
ncbi:MAG: recombination regulator RecX [Oscillospiraceae bacterium]|jgi:regulatory protein|nr:recombination regulator RecX [Oscillospiraceae bacterium]